MNTELTLSELLETRQNYEKIINQKLLEMDVWFQNHMWDGYSDEDDPKFLSQEDFDAIQALTGKIEHMILHIGCPGSVIPMIESIINRKIKYWQGDHLFYGGMDVKGWEKGRQLKSKDEINIVRKAGESEQPNNDKYNFIIKGHFRWNNRGYILSRKATDLLAQYYSENF